MLLDGGDNGPPNKLTDADMVGKVFGYLKVLSRAPSLKKWTTAWLCQCSRKGCTRTSIVVTARLRSGHTTSCGCGSRRQHDGTHTPEYAIWKAMHQRCSNPNFDDFHNYGGRGISVCESWNDFAVFISDMGRRPSSEYSIDRINTNGNYEPTNCKWSTRIEQGNNRRDTIHITIGTDTKPLTAWCREFDADADIVRKRIRSGWDPLEAMITPRGKKHVAIHRRQSR